MTMLVGSALVLAVMAPFAYPALPGCTKTQTDDPVAICYNDERAEAEQTVQQAEEPWGVLEARAGLTCLPPARWDPARIPSAMIVKTTAGVIERMPFDAAWAAAQAGEVWVLEACV